jgi:hypothetical protein
LAIKVTVNYVQRSSRAAGVSIPPPAKKPPIGRSRKKYVPCTIPIKPHDSVQGILGGAFIGVVMGLAFGGVESVATLLYGPKEPDE